MHKFSDTGMAYDHTQCRDDIKTGDLLVIESEKVIGLAWTWPVAVTKHSGHLHGIQPGGHSKIVHDAKFTTEQVLAAVSEAEKRSWEVDDGFVQLARTYRV